MNYSDIYKDALDKIKHDQKYKNNCCCIISVTGPTGEIGPTAGLNASLTLKRLN